MSNNIKNSPNTNTLQSNEQKIDNKQEQKTYTSNSNFIFSQNNKNPKNDTNKKSKYNSKSKSNENLNSQNKSINSKKMEILKKVVEIIKFAGIAKIDEIKLKTKELSILLKKNTALKNTSLEYSNVSNTSMNESISVKSMEYNTNISSKPLNNTQMFKKQTSHSIQKNLMESGIIEKTKDTKEYYRIVSPMVGTFYRAPSPNSPPYVKEGDYIEEGTTVCIIEAMKLMNEIKADKAGKIVRILVENAKPVEKGTVLFELDTEATK